MPCCVCGEGIRLRAPRSKDTSTPVTSSARSRATCINHCRGASGRGSSFRRTCWGSPTTISKYLIILRLALSEPRVTYLGAPNPSTFLRLLDVLNSRRELLIDSLATGRFDALDALILSSARSSPGGSRSDPDRAARLRSLPALTFANVWPEVRLVTTWTGGSCGIALESVRGKLPRDTTVMELGYQSSECRGTIALEPEMAGGLPTLHHHFLEFAEQNAWDSGRRECLTLGQLAAGRRYYVLFTTAAGPHRHYERSPRRHGVLPSDPAAALCAEGLGVTSLTGELYEAQAIEAIQDAAARCRVRSSFLRTGGRRSASAYVGTRKSTKAPPRC